MLLVTAGSVLCCLSLLVVFYAACHCWLCSMLLVTAGGVLCCLSLLDVLYAVCHCW